MKCASCGYVAFPRQPYGCEKCGAAGTALSNIELSSNGTLASYATVHMHQAKTIAAPAFPVDRVVDTTGAGDLFAAGFLFGLARGFGHDKAAQLGALGAAEVISHLGARPEPSLRALAEENGLTG